MGGASPVKGTFYFWSVLFVRTFFGYSFSFFVFNVCLIVLLYKFTV